MIEEFLRFIDQDSKITVRSGRTNFGDATAHVMSTMKGVPNLLELGIKGEVDTALYEELDFWRGLIDGDGSVSQGARRPTVLLCSGKPRDIVAFSEYVGRLFECQGPKPYCSKNGVWAAMVGHGKARALAVYLYKGRYSAVPRKQATALSFEHLTFRTGTRLLPHKIAENNDFVVYTPVESA
jgi:hypothetical protein